MKTETSPKSQINLTNLLAVLFLGGAPGYGLAADETRPDEFRAVSEYYQVDTSWPRTLPNDWFTGEVGGTCVDENDLVIIANRNANESNLAAKEDEIARRAPPIIELDTEGNVVNAWGDFDTVPQGMHGCYVDFEGNIWVGGNDDAIVQKYSREGKLLLQIGTHGKFDSDDGTRTGKLNNSAKDGFFRPTDIAVDPDNGDVYISDGYGNRRVVVFNREGKYLRQFGRQATEEETRNMTPGVFTRSVHCISMSNDGLLYVCDREGGRVQVFDKQGRFKQNIVVPRRRADLPGNAKAYAAVMSPDPDQKYLFIASGDDAIWIVERRTGKVLEGFGNLGLMTGQFNYLHSLGVDSKGNLYTGETRARRAQKLVLVKPLP